MHYCESICHGCCEAGGQPAPAQTGREPQQREAVSRCHVMQSEIAGIKLRQIRQATFNRLRLAVMISQAAVPPRKPALTDSNRDSQTSLLMG